MPYASDPQSLNRYSYCRNNPINVVDPSGHKWKWKNIFKAIGIAIIGAVATVLTGGLATTFAIGTFWTGVATGAVAGATIGGAFAAATGGNIGMGMLTGAIGGAVFGFVGGVAQGLKLGATMHTLAHFAGGAATGAINAAVTGDNIGIGAIIGGVSAGITQWAGGIKGFAVPGTGTSAYVQNLVRRSVLGGLIGGATSSAMGGSFGSGFYNGAMSSAISFTANDWMHSVLLPWTANILLNAATVMFPQVAAVRVGAMVIRGALAVGAMYSAKDMQYPGNDPNKAPGPGFEWKGKPGSTPAEGKGNWHNKETGVSLHPDLDHAPPKGPHWGYSGPDGKYDLFPNGKVEPNQ